MSKLIKFFDEFYSADNVAGIIGDKVITCDNPQLQAIQGDPAFLSFDEFISFSKCYCEYCHSKLDGDICYSCGVSYEKEPALNG